jgi:hypothetical protein
MLRVNEQWRVTDAANDLDDVPGCENLFDP